MVKGPSGFPPDGTEPDKLLWHKFDWPYKDGEEVHHPGLRTSAEPQREHKRSLEFQPRWFDTGSKWSERSRNPSGGGRDGYTSQFPWDIKHEEIPQDEPHDTGVTPLPLPNPAEAAGPNFDRFNMMPGYFPWDLPPNQMPETDLPHPSPMFANDQPGPTPHQPRGPERAPMLRPPGTPSDFGFLPVQNPPDPIRTGRQGKEFDNSREDFDYDYTGKKVGYMDETLPKTRVTKSARTREDLDDIDAIFPKGGVPELDPETPGTGPHMRHRNERHVPMSPIQGDNDMMQKNSQQLIPNQKMAIAVNPVGQMGDRLVIMSPLFSDLSPAMQALKSHRFENHGAVVIDGPPMWLMGLEGALKALDKNSTNDSPEELLKKVVQFLAQKGLSIEYVQQPRGV